MYTDVASIAILERVQSQIRHLKLLSTKALSNHCPTVKEPLSNHYPTIHQPLPSNSTAIKSPLSNHDPTVKDSFSNHDPTTNPTQEDGFVAHRQTRSHDGSLCWGNCGPWISWKAGALAVVARVDLGAPGCSWCRRAGRKGWSSTLLRVDNHFN